MRPTTRLIEDEAYPIDDIAPEYDFAALHQRAKTEGREYRGMLSGKLIRLAPDVAEAFPIAVAAEVQARRNGLQGAR